MYGPTDLDTKHVAQPALSHVTRCVLVRAVVLAGSAGPLNDDIQATMVRRLYEASFLQGTACFDPLQRLISQLTLLHAGGKDSALPLGDYYYYGWGDVRQDVDRAVELYSVAEQHGSPQAAFNLAYIVRHCSKIACSAMLTCRVLVEL